eukprot:CAMPEP_0119085640 /NCGR_PEP_ID=MMETSP1178-20130426/134651_1 /TAXON_ID=33656 /ORGANISM="unid sp, Strain CCMP2000" /LENGTH=133 /DNA_ID=CAMNT_0007068711 /DNA_START=356 /DNA_END=757 /DNA_ORIENTATION=-
MAELQAEDRRAAQLLRFHERGILLWVGCSKCYADLAQSSIAQSLCGRLHSALRHQPVGIEPKRHTERFQQPGGFLEHTEPQQGLADSSECNAVVLALRSGINSSRMDLLGAWREAFWKRREAAFRRNDKARAA